MRTKANFELDAGAKCLLKRLFDRPLIGGSTVSVAVASGEYQS